MKTWHCFQATAPEAVCHPTSGIAPHPGCDWFPRAVRVNSTTVALENTEGILKYFTTADVFPLPPKE